MHFRYSKDGGESWQEEEQDLPSFVRPGEPVGLLHDGKLLIVSRSYDPAAYDPETDTSVYAQLWSETGWHPLMAKHTTIRVAGKRGRQDTLDIDFNPVTKRIEAAVPARSGGGEGRFHAKEMSLNLWSIDPSELFAGSAQWRFECTLFARLRNGDRPADGRFGRADGFHPGGAVIDAKRGVQHVFVYIGFKEGPAGVFPPDTIAGHAEAESVFGKSCEFESLTAGLAALSSVFRKYGYISVCHVGAGPSARPPSMVDAPLRYVTVFMKGCTL